MFRASNCVTISRTRLLRLFACVTAARVASVAAIPPAARRMATTTAIISLVLIDIVATGPSVDGHGLRIQLPQALRIDIAETIGHCLSPEQAVLHRPPGFVFHGEDQGLWQSDFEYIFLPDDAGQSLSLIHISEPTRLGMIS